MGHVVCACRFELCVWFFFCLTKEKNGKCHMVQFNMIIYGSIDCEWENDYNNVQDILKEHVPNIHMHTNYVVQAIGECRTRDTSAYSEQFNIF